MPRPGHVRRVVAVLAVVAAVLSLSGCFKASQDVEVRADGSGSLVLHAEVDREVLAAVTARFNVAGVAGPDAALFQPVDKTFPDGAKVRAVDTPDRATLDASFDFSGPDEYRRKLEEVRRAIAVGPEATLPEGSINIRRVDDRLEVALVVREVTAETLDPSILRDLLLPGTAPEIVVTLTMPGRILSSNGTASGRTVTWDLLDRGSPATLTASSTLDRPGLPAWAVPAGAGLVLVVLLLMILGTFLRRGHTAPAPADPVPAGPQPVGPRGSFFPPSPPLGAPAGWPAPPAPPPPEPSPVPQAPEPGWYADPAGGGGLRYWDGRGWTSRTL